MSKVLRQNGILKSLNVMDGKCRAILLPGNVLLQVIVREDALELTYEA